MQVAATQLATHLKHHPLCPLYFVSGNEPLLIQEVQTEIIQHARSQGFAEILKFQIGAEFDCRQLSLATESLSLFANKRMLCCQLMKWPDAVLSDWLINYCQQPQENMLLMLTMPKMSRQQQNSRLGKALAAVGTHIPIWPIDQRHLPGWLKQRAKKQAVHLTHDATLLLARRTEGNLLAAVQTLEKLKLHFAEQSIDAKALDAFIEDAAQFDVFHLITATLLGRSERALRILAILRVSAIEPTIILWALTKDLRLIYQLHQAQSPIMFFKQQKIWKSKQFELQEAAKTLTPLILRKLLVKADKIDQIIKGVINGDPWQAIHQLISSTSLREPTFPCLEHIRPVQCATSKEGCRI